MSVLRALSVPKMIAVLCLLALGANGLVQVGLQKQMSVKAQKLKSQLEQTQQLSGGMKAGLVGLTELSGTSEHMASTLDLLRQTTSAMNDGLGQLEHTVGGIGSTIMKIDVSTQSAGSQVEHATQTSKQLLDLMQGIYSVNGDVIADLNKMIQDQKRINENLQEMNNKTAVLPKWGGNR